MKNYTITVNGNVYDVQVEEGISTGAAPKAAPAAPRKVAAPIAAGTSVGTAGKVKITAGAAGKVVKVDTVVGQSVKKGDTIITIEAMKMEIPQVAPQDGVVASIHVAAGDPCDAGALLASLN